MNLVNVLQKLQNIEQGVESQPVYKQVTTEGNQDLVNVLKGLAAIQEQSTDEVEITNEGSMKQKMMDDAEKMSLEQFKDKYGDEDWIEEFWRTTTGEEDEVEEAARSPYAIGMAQAMKSTGDKPPLEKSTIKKAHEIAKSVMKNENLEECGMGGVGYQMPQQESNDRYTLNIQRGDKSLNVTTDSPEELMMIMKLAGVGGQATVSDQMATEEFANTPDATKEREPHAYGDIRDWGRKGTGKGQPGSALNKPFGQGDNPLSEQAMFDEYRKFKQDK